MAPKKGYIPNPFKAKEPPRTPITGFGMRIKNVCFNNFRGLIGAIVPLCALSWQSEQNDHAKTVELVWMLMFWLFLVQPVAIPATGLVPVFLFPMAGVISSIEACSCYMNENIVLYLLTAMLLVLLNNSGVDRRIALWFVCSGDACQYSAKRLIFKFSSAAFFLSMFSNRLIITSVLTQYATSAITKLHVALQLCILQVFVPKDKEYPDIFNYLAYSAFAFPVAFLMFIFCFVYHMQLANSALQHCMPSAQMEELRSHFIRFKQEIPTKVSLHEKLSVLFLIIMLCMFFFRWCKWIDGWADFARSDEAPLLPKVKDATVAAIFVILLHTVPKSYSFFKFLDVEKKSELPPLKPESAILWWRFVDRNVNYAYYFVFGASLSLVYSSIKTGLAPIIAENMGTIITSKSWNDGLFLILFITSLLVNVMSSVPACTVFLPFVLCSSLDAAAPWPGKVYVAALGVGIASSFGFCCPFLYTPAYFCHHTGKVPIRKMIKYSFIPVWICLITLFVALMIWAPYLFDPEDSGVMPLDVPGAAPTTPAEPTPEN
uniref:Citrate transporter-like domain-containing protein n=1 Tax=Heliothis virescens TaxID=7102 RepID=A0A2A4J283_HELVI